MATRQATSRGGHVGDWVEARGIHGQPPRRGQIIELLGRGSHERYRVRWDEKHESILYPADGVVIVRRSRTRQARRQAAHVAATMRPLEPDATGETTPSDSRVTATPPNEERQP